MSITSYAQADAYLKAPGARSKTDRPAPVGSSTRIVRDLVAPETISVVYHRTPVVTYHADGRVFVWAGEWFTKSTVEKINAYAGIGWDRGRFEVHKPRRGGHGDALAYVGCGDDWPTTSSGKRIPETFSRVAEITRLLADPDNPRGLIDWADWPSTYLRTGYEGAPLYPCRCKLCKHGATSWQSLESQRSYERAVDTVSSASRQHYIDTGRYLPLD